MTKKDMARTLAARAGVTQAQALAVVRGLFDGIVDVLVSQGRIELRNFGVFEVHRRKARRARNPRTGAAVAVPPRNAISFQAGRQVRQRMQQLVQVPHPASGAAGEGG
jgi:DNA-binding protein HU-beta/integration host factor subunit beta